MGPQEADPPQWQHQKLGGCYLNMVPFSKISGLTSTCTDHRDPINAFTPPLYPGRGCAFTTSGSMSISALKLAKVTSSSSSKQMPATGRHHNLSFETVRRQKLKRSQSVQSSLARRQDAGASFSWTY